MARKKKPEEHVNHERWLISYADFITLLFAFFVVMYSISSVNEGKYRVLADSMVVAFRSPARSINPVQVGRSKSRQKSKSSRAQAAPKPVQVKPGPIGLTSFLSHQQNIRKWALGKASHELDSIAIDVELALKALIDDGVVSVRKGKFWLEVQINASILFDSASAIPTAEANKILERMGSLLKKFPNRIRVEGFTDNQPISTPHYESNWELSSNRATSIVRLFAAVGVDPTRMSAVGYGEYHPIADNRTSEGRATNRRVVIVIVADTSNRQILGAPEFEALRGPPTSLSTSEINSHGGGFGSSDIHLPGAFVETLSADGANRN